MPKRSHFTSLFCLTSLLVLAVLMMAGCGPTTQTSTHTTKMLKGKLTPTATPTGTLVPGTPVTLPGPPTPTPMPTPVPLINVSWTTPETMYTLSFANVRSAPSTGAHIVTTEAVATAVTVFGSAEGDVVNGNATWDRITDQNSDPEYILSVLLGVNKPAPPPTATPIPTPISLPSGVPPAPISTGKVIFVDLTTQHLYAYQDGALVNDFLITSGRPELLTPTGTFTVLDKATNVTFYSPWPQGSPYYYAPEFVPYALRLTNSGIFIHAAPWREPGDFGPGTQYPHILPDGTQANGSHGCINTTTPDAAWTYNWAPIGTPVVISY